MTRPLSDITGHLFAQMERLAGAADAEAIRAEAARAEAMVSVADQILDTARVQLQAAKLYVENPAALPLLPQVGPADADTARAAARLTAQPPKAVK